MKCVKIKVGLDKVSEDWFPGQSGARCLERYAQMKKTLRQKTAKIERSCVVKHEAKRRCAGRQKHNKYERLYRKWEVFSNLICEMQ